MQWLIDGVRRFKLCCCSKFKTSSFRTGLGFSCYSSVCLTLTPLLGRNLTGFYTFIADGQTKSSCNVHQLTMYTPKAVVIDNHLPRQPLISSYVPDWPLPPRVYIPSESEMALRARIYAYNRHLSFDVAFICSTLTHCGVCHLSVWRLKWEVSYVHQSVWRWKWFFCQSNYVLQRLRLCRTSDTVFRREIDSRRQWGYGTCYGGIVSPLRRSVLTM